MEKATESLNWKQGTNWTNKLQKTNEQREERRKRNKKNQAKGNVTGYSLRRNDVPLGNLPYGQFA